MDRFLMITRIANEDGSETVTRAIVTLYAAIDWASSHWNDAMRPWIDNVGGLSAALMSRGVGDAYDGPDYMLAGNRACDRFVYVGDLGDLANAAAEGPSARVTASGRPVSTFG